VFSERPNDLLSTQRSGALRRGELNVRILIVTQEATIGTGMKLVVDSHATKIQVLVIQTLEGGAMDWTNEGGSSITLPEAIREAELIIIYHPDNRIAVEVKKQAGDKLLLPVFGESAIPISSISIDLFHEMWPRIAEAFRAKLEKGS